MVQMPNRISHMSNQVLFIVNKGAWYGLTGWDETHWEQTTRPLGKMLQIRRLLHPTMPGFADLPIGRILLGHRLLAIDGGRVDTGGRR